jgi:DNA polymerase-3 subunit chi
VTEIRFYHLQRSSAEKAVPDLLKKAVERGHKVLFKLPTASRRQFYDEWLWRFAPESFLPHAQEGDEADADHAIWLSTNDNAPNQPTMALVAEGAALPDVEGLLLICNVFDSANQDQARQLWATLKNQKDLTLTYWKQQDNGGWLQENK